MNAEEERLYTQYYYNSVIEFIYFIILYLQTFETTSLNNLSKHVKFFKREVTSLILSFEGKTLEEKLYQMLNTLEYFVCTNNEVKINESVCWNNNLFEEIVLSKCTDLILKGLNNLDDICNHLNYNNIISIDKESLLHVIDKYSYISVKTGKTVTLHHLHGLLGFEDFVCNSVVNYFYNILYHGKILTVKEIENHSKILTFCGTHNILMVFSILNCSDQFLCKNGYVWLKKSEKYPKQQPICVEKLEAKYLSRSLPVGQIVHNMYGQSLYKWSGEIVKLTENSGNIYCVLDFTNGHQGIFCIYFNTAALHIISEVGSLKKYLHVRDTVEFDAEYYVGKKFNRCWRATRVKLLCKTKLDYDESLYEKIISKTESYRNECVRCSDINWDNSKLEGMQLAKKAKVDYKISSISDVMLESDPVNTYRIENNLYETVSNLSIPDCVFMFGYVQMLMADKAIAVAKHENKIYNVLFVKDVYLSDEFQTTFVKGQKIIAFVPYLKNLQNVHVATLVYGLNNEETKDTDENNVLPQEFANKILLKNDVSKLCSKSCSNCSILKDLPLLERFKIDSKLICTNGFCTTTAKISMISTSFFYVTAHINDCDVILPISKQSIPQSLQENMKLNSRCEISVIPNIHAFFSRVISVRITV